MSLAAFQQIHSASLTLEMQLAKRTPNLTHVFRGVDEIMVFLFFFIFIAVNSHLWSRSKPSVAVM